MYQSGDVAIYYLIGMAAYFWAYSEGEVCLLVPCFYWTGVLMKFRWYVLFHGHCRKGRWSGRCDILLFALFLAGGVAFGRWLA